MTKLFFLLIMLISVQLSADNKLNIITSTYDLADLVKVIGKEKVNVISLSKGNQDPHFIEPKPSMVIQVKNADLVIRIGMDLDLWIQSIIDASRNSKVMFSGIGYIDASENIEKLEIPQGKIDASMGDIHIYGNPHYWLDPENAKPILKQIVKKLSELKPIDAEYFDKNYKEYVEKLNFDISKWNEIMKSYNQTKIVTYHNSWPYFAKRFNLQIAGFVEPKPGIPPSPSHIVSLIEKIKKEKVKVIIVEPYFNLKIAESIAKDSGAKVVVLAPSIGANKEINTYLELFEYDINKLTEVLKK